LRSQSAYTSSVGLGKTDDRLPELTDVVQLAVQPVIVSRIEVQGVEEVEDCQLLAALDVFLERGGNSRLLGGVFADLTGFLDEVCVDFDVGRRG